MKIYKNIASGIVLGLERTLKQKQPARIVLPQLFKMNRQWGSRDRKLVGRIFFDILRCKALYSYAGEISDENTTYYWELIGVWCVVNNTILPTWEEFTLINTKRTLARLETQLHPALKESFPAWINRLGEKALGQKLWHKEMEALNNAALLVLRVNRLKITPEKLKETLFEQYEIIALLVDGYPDDLVVEKHINLQTFSLYKKGYFEIQDANSQRVASFSKVLPGQKVLDICAGSGGKALHLATCMLNKGTLIATDLRIKKLDQLKIRAKRNGVQIIKTVQNQSLSENKHQSFDVVLVDAPCSGTGTIRRRPEIKWQLSETALSQFQDQQSELLQNSALFTKPMGKLVYVTCSILKEENQDQISSFLTSPMGQNFDLEKENSLLSHQTGFDGFYMACLKRKRNS